MLGDNCKVIVASTEVAMTKEINDKYVEKSLGDLTLSFSYRLPVSLGGLFFNCIYSSNF